MGGMSHDSMLSETVEITGQDGHPVEAYAARLLEGGPRGGIVVIHHMPGYDSATKEIVRRFAVEGYDAICPNLYYREAPGAAPDDAAATARALGGVPDERLVGDVAGAVAWLKALPSSNGKVATIGYCSGGRQSWLANGSLDLDAAIVCYGAFIVGTPPEGFPLQVRSLADLAPTQSGPVLGMFGNDDSHPSPEQVDEIEKLLQDNGKPYEFHRYDGAGHGFFAVDRTMYRPEAAVDGWEKILAFLDRHVGA
jgi:carboxymethylenebutenolidase